MINVLFAAKPEAWAEYEPHLREAFIVAGLAVNLSTETDHPATIDYIVYAPNGALSDFTPFTRLKAVLNLWAGVEDVVGNDTLRVPLCRMVGGGLTESMIEWVTGHVLRYHLGMDAHIHGQDGVWRSEPIAPIAADRQVCILGLGALGTACGQALRGLGFKVSGWSRNPKKIDGIDCFDGADGLDAALAGAEIVVTLLPSTPDTENVLDPRTLALMPKGAFVINPGRGPLIDDNALLAALDSGQITHATLDVFRIEPLPEDHRFWTHPKVTVTPHIASATRAAIAVHVIAENIALGEAGKPFLHVVDRGAGY
jgi:glyoxylate/hydroxypyruvate reductase A